MADAAHARPTRLDAETFAILVNHAIKDQTAGSEGDDVIADFGVEVPPESVASINEKRDFPGNRIVPGARPWIRSALGTTPDGIVATVYVVEKVEAPRSALSTPDDPWVYWAQAVLTLAWSDDGWKLTNYRSEGASEYERFSQSTWRGVMDSGRGWRRFDVAGAP